MSEFIDPLIGRYCSLHTQANSKALQALEAESIASIHGAQMLSGKMVIKLLKFFIRLQRPKICVDVGTYTGLSALAIAEATPENTRVFTLDKKGQVGHQTALKNIQKSPFGYKVKFCTSNAKDDIMNLPDAIDFAFIDADKKNTRLYFDLLFKKLRSGGLMVVDDVLWRKEVLAPEDARAKAMDDFNRYIARHPELDNILLPLRHGLNVIYKR